MSRRPDSDIELVLRHGVHGWAGLKAAKRFANPVADWLAGMPAAGVLAVTLVIGVLLAPLGLFLIPAVFMIRHHGTLSSEIAEVFGPESDELRDWRARPGDLRRALELDRELGFVTDPLAGGFIAPDSTEEAPLFRAGFGRKGL